MYGISTSSVQEIVAAAAVAFTVLTVPVGKLEDNFNELLNKASQHKNTFKENVTERASRIFKNFQDRVTCSLYIFIYI